MDSYKRICFPCVSEADCEEAEVTLSYRGSDRPGLSLLRMFHRTTDMDLMVTVCLCWAEGLHTHGGLAGKYNVAL